jgi:hypothetical protein
MSATNQPAVGSASSPEEGVSTNVQTGDDLGAWVVQIVADVYRGPGHPAETVEIGAGETRIGHKVRFEHDADWARLKAWVEEPDGSRVASVEVNAHALLTQLVDVAYRAVAFEDGKPVNPRVIRSVEQHLGLLHEALGTAGAEEGFDPYAAVKALQVEVGALRTELTRWQGALHVRDHLTSEQFALLQALTVTGWVNYLFGADPDNAGTLRHTYEVTRPGWAKLVVTERTPEFITSLTALTCEMADSISGGAHGG